VAVNGVAEVAVAEISGDGGVDVSVPGGASVMDITVVATVISVPALVAVAVSAAACPLQADKTSASRAVTINSFLIIFILLCYHV
jgi:hypothetical protein